MKQLAIAQEVKLLTETIEEMGNPITEDSSNLLVFSQNIADMSCECHLIEDQIAWIREHYEKFIEEKLLSHNFSIANPIKKNNLYLCSRPPI